MTRRRAAQGVPQRVPQSEASFQQAVIDLAHVWGWRVAHFRAARTSEGWRTPVSADGKGFPDLCMVRSGRLVIAELKADRGRLTREQEAWIADLSNVSGELGDRVEVHVWRPVDWALIERTLRR